MIYHNITPPEFLDGDLRNFCISGIKQLKELKGCYDFYVGDSQFNVDCLRDMGITTEGIVIPIVVEFPNTDNLNRIDHKEKIFLFVGRVVQNKKIEDIIEIFNYYFCNINAKSRLLLSGNLNVSQEYTQRLRAQIASLPSRNNIELMGKVSDEELRNLYLKTDIYISMSEHEGLGIPLLEAMNYRIPVLAYNAAAVGETMGNSGILVNTKNPETVAKICDVVLSNPSIRDEIVERQVLNLKRFTKAEITRKLSALIEQWKGEGHASQAVCSAGFAAPSRMPRILFDVTVLHEWLRNGYNAGIARVASNLFSHLKPHAEVIPVKLEVDNGECYCRIIDMNTYSESGQRLRPAYDDIYLMSEFQLPGVQVPENHPAPSLLREMGVRCFAVVYDILPLQMPQYFEKATAEIFETYLRRLVENYDGILTDSRTVADEVVAYCEEHGITGRHPVNIYWFHPGVEVQTDLTGGVPDDVRAFFDTSDNIFLMVGTVEPRKNHTLVLDAFEQRWKNKKNDKLCIVGRPGWQVEKFIQRLKNHPEYGKRLVLFEGADDNALCYMYRHATALIQASMGEGFGLPLVEAGAFSLPILCSDIPVFREVTDGFALYFNKTSKESLNKAIDEFIERRSQGNLPDSSKIERLNWAESTHRVFQIIAGQLPPYKTIDSGNKRLLIVHPNNFVTGGQGSNNRVITLVRLLKEIGFDVDLFSYDFLNRGEPAFQNFEQDNKEGLVRQLIYYDCRQGTSYGKPTVLEKLRIKEPKKELLGDWAFEGAKRLFDETLKANHYDVVVMFYTYSANLLKNITEKVKKVYFMEDCCFLQQYYFHKNANIDVSLGVLLDEELERLTLFDEIFCISNDERIFYSKLTGREIGFVPHLLPDVKKVEKPVSQRRWDIFFIGFNNPYNVEGLRWFFDEVYPKLSPDMRMVLVGSAATQLDIKHENVEIIPFAPDLDEIYENAKVAICPMFGGTGMKVKVVESMAKGLPVVCNERGVDGFPDKNECGCLVTQDAGQFAEYLTRLVEDQEFYEQTLEKANRYYDTYFNVEKYRDLVKKTLQ